MNKGAYFKLYHNLKWCIGLNYTREAQFPTKTGKQVSFSFFTLCPHSGGPGGDLGTFTSRCTVVWPFLLMLLNISAVKPIVSATVPYVVKSLMLKRAPNLWHPKRGRVFFWRTCSRWPGLVRVHRPAQNISELGLKQKNNPSMTPKRENDGRRFLPIFETPTNVSGPLLEDVTTTPAPTAFVARQFLAGLARYDLALFHWPLECSGWRIYFPTLFHLL